MADIFFSYSREDLERILPIVRALEQKGYSVFWDRTIPTGKSWREVISGELDAASCVMVAWSKTSIKSNFVIEEADHGSHHSSLVPLLLDPVKPPFGFGTIQAADLAGWDGAVEAGSFQKLLLDISAHLGVPKPMESQAQETASDTPAIITPPSGLDSDVSVIYVTEEANPDPQTVMDNTLSPDPVEEAAIPAPQNEMENAAPPDPAAETAIITPRSETDSVSSSDHTSREGNTERKGTGKFPTFNQMLLLSISIIVVSTINYLANRPESAPIQVEQPSTPGHQKPTYTEIYETYATNKNRADSPYPELVQINAGCFQMGSTQGGNDELPVHQVCIDHPFYLSKTEVTFAQFDRLPMPKDRKLPKDAWGRGNQPVINVSWQDAQDYTQWLTKETGVPCRLPSEAEWEYAARAGTTTEYALPAPHGSNDIKGRALANCEGCGSQKYKNQTAPVGSFKSNAWGLHDMHGNVWEWTADCRHDSYMDAPTDGSAWSEENGGNCNFHVMRGGSWVYNPEFARSAYRFRSYPDSLVNVVGFRVLCSGPFKERPK